MKPRHITISLLTAVALTGAVVPARAADKPVIHDAEYYVLDAMYGEKWAAEDKGLDAKLAALKAKYGTPPNIIHVLFDDTPVGEVGIPFIQKQRGWETPNINKMAAEGINFTRMYSQPSCTPTRGACMTGRIPIRNGMYKVGFPYEYGGLAASEVTTADVLGKAGFATGFFGKWHLGDIEASYATKHGFDEAIWMPYNQLCSVLTLPGQVGVLSAATLVPQMFPKDPYDMDLRWRPVGLVNALEGKKGGPVLEVGKGLNHDDYLKLEGEFEARTLAFIEKNAKAKKPFYCAWWPALGSFLPAQKKLTSNGGVAAELITPLDARIGTLMAKLKDLGIAENTLVVLMADNGPMVHNGPPGMIDTIYRGGKGDFLEGGVRVPAFAWWPGTIAPGQLVGDIIDCTDLFTTFARIGGAMGNIPNDRIIDGIDQTSLLLNGDSFSRRDYVHIYTGTNYMATVKGRYKRHWVPGGLTVAPLYDLYTDPREENGKLIQMIATKGMFDLMRARHEVWMAKYPNTPEARDFPLQGIENARPETRALGQPRMNLKELPFNPLDVIKQINEWAGSKFDGMDD